MEVPEIREVSVHWGGGGKVQLEDYGKQSSGYSCNVTRKYAIPADWDYEAVSDFTLSVVEMIRADVEPVLAMEHEERMKARDALN